MGIVNNSAYLRHVQTERVECNEHALVHHHSTRTVRLAEVGVRCVTVDRIAARQIPRISVDRRVHRDSGADSQHKHPCHEGLLKMSNARIARYIVRIVEVRVLSLCKAEASLLVSGDAFSWVCMEQRGVMDYAN